MKSILLSIKPKYVADILNGRKTIEIRKTMPKCDLPIDVYIYCTKDKDLSWYQGCLPIQKDNDEYHKMRRERLVDKELNGKVVAKFTVRKVEEIKFEFLNEEKTHIVWQTETLSMYDLEHKSCLTGGELYDYTKAEKGYAYHIEDLVIFDKPKELWEFKRASCKGCFAENTNYCDEKYCRITKAPQNFIYIESEDQK